MTLRTPTLSVITATFLLLLGAPSLANAQEASHLKGLTALAVHVGSVVSPIGTFTPSLTEAEIEQRLRQIGIIIVPAQAPRPFGSQGNLWVHAVVIRSSAGTSQWFLHTTVTMSGSVVLAGSNEKAEAITWQTERYRTAETSQIDSALREDVTFLIDDFAKAYQLANPR